jgi:hypothetical protein
MLIVKGEWPANDEGKRFPNPAAVGAALLAHRRSQRLFAKMMAAQVKPAHNGYGENSGASLPGSTRQRILVNLSDASVDDVAVY